jgi:hypothetical protein
MRAIAVRADYKQIIDIADDASLTSSSMTTATSASTLTTSSALHIETRKRLMGKMKPKKYGDRINTAISDPDGKML